MKYYGASEEDVRNGLVTDVYFDRTKQVIEAFGMKDVIVRMEFVMKSFPDPSWKWAILAGVNEAMYFLKDKPVTVRCMTEGSVFYAGEPVFEICGKYNDFLEMETSVLGFLSQASGIATRAARCKILAGDRVVASFGSRRMHPAIAPMIEYAAFIGGCDGVSTLIGAQYTEEEPTGTMPHSLVLMFGDVVDAAEAFDQVIDKKISRVALTDGLNDERFEAIRVADSMGKRLQAIRLDTPFSRRGSLKAIAEEIRWELDLRGFNHVKLFASGGLGEKNIIELNSVIDAYGIGGEIASGEPCDFSANIIEITDAGGTPQPISKRGVKSGAKQVYVRGDGFRRVVPINKDMSMYDDGDYYNCSSLNTLLNLYQEDERSPREIREDVLDSVKNRGLTV